MSASLASSVYPSRRKPLAACVAALFGLSSSPAVLAGTAFVTNCSNSVVQGSLPWAATQAVNPGDIIDMTGISDFSSCFHNYDGFAQTIVLASAVTVATGVTINGPNTSGSKVLAVSTSNFDRVFYSAGYLTINNLGIKYATATTPSGTFGVYGGCVFARNGIYLTGVVLDHCTASATGTTDASGGSIGTYSGPVVLTNSTITHSTATSAGFGVASGGALFARNGDVTLTGSQVSGTATTQNGAARGGGIATQHPGNTVSLTNSEVGYSFAITFGGQGLDSAQGGGIYSAGTVTLANSTVRGSSAYQYFAGASGGAAAGGCIFAAQGAYVSDNSFVINCFAGTASDGAARGGGIYSGAYVTLLQSLVEFAEASSAGGNAYGGGIFSVGGTAGAYSSVYGSAANSSFKGEGGGIFSQGGVQFKYGTIAASVAQRGGGIAVASGDLYLRGATLSSNHAGSDASALAMLSGGSSTATIVNSTISGNTVGSASGKYAVFIGAHSTKLYNSTIAYNTGGTGAGTYLAGAAGSTASLYSTLMSSNSLSNGTQNDFAKSPNVTISFSSSNNLIRHPGGLVPGDTLTGAVACPHLHKLAYNGGPTATHRLGGVIHSAGKNPAIDAGSNSFYPSPNTDQRGGYTLATTPPRVSGSAADIGAYEVQQNDVVFDTDFETCPN